MDHQRRASRRATADTYHFVLPFVLLSAENREYDSRRTSDFSSTNAKICREKFR